VNLSFGSVVGVRYNARAADLYISCVDGGGGVFFCASIRILVRNGGAVDNTNTRVERDENRLNVDRPS